MHKILYTAILLFFYTSLFSQNKLQVQIEHDSVGRTVPFDGFGMNVERMFYRTLDGNGQMPEEILNDLLEGEDLVYRWPGGATANFYHYFDGTSKGYGLERAEIEAVAHPMSCNLPKGSEYCMSFEQNTPRNYIHSMMEFADVYMQRTNKKKRIVWMPNIFTFYLNNKSEILKFNEMSSLQDAETMMLSGEISEDFYKRIKDVFDVYEILNNHPSIHLEGVEYGNEFYFHQNTTGEKYNEVNNNLLWLFNENQYRNSMKRHMSLYKSIINFFNTAIFDQNSNIKTAAPVGIIAHTGNMQNMNRIWNEGVRDSILDIVDGVIHHFYFKPGDGPRINPEEAENPGQAENLKKIKSIADDFIHVRIPKVDKQYDDFFGLTEKGKKMWLTEFNTDHIQTTGYFSEWQNTFFHSYFQFEAFLSFIDNPESDVVEYAFPHLWASHINDYDYGAYAAVTNLDGTYKKIKRATFNTYVILGNLAKKNLKQIGSQVSNAQNLDRSNLFTKAYIEEGDNEDEGNIVFVFSNKSGEPISLNLNEDFNFSFHRPAKYELGNFDLEYLKADHIYSANGRTFRNSNIPDEGENIHLETFQNLSVSETLVLPKYSVGYLTIPFQREIDESYYELVYTSTAGGHLNGDSVQYILAGEQSDSIEAIPEEGYIFSGWSDGLIDNPRVDYNVLADASVQAIFVKEDATYFTLTYNSTSGGYLVGDSTQLVEEGENGTAIQVISHTGYSFDGWSDGRVDNPRVDENVSSDIQVQALFEVSTGIQNAQTITRAIYPNPTSDVLTIELKEAEKYTYRLYQATGQLSQSGFLNQSVSQLDLKALAPALYILILQDEQGQQYHYQVIKN